MTTRIACKSLYCEATILPATAQDTGNLCMPCFKKMKQQEREDYIIKNHRVIDLYQGITNPLDIIRVFHRHQLSDPLVSYIPYTKAISDCYKRLNYSQLQNIRLYSIDLYNDSKQDQAKEILSCLVSFCHLNIDSVLEYMIDAEDYYPPYLFKKASDTIKEKILDKFLADEDIENDVFRLLVWLAEDKISSTSSIDLKIKNIVSSYKKPAYRIKSKISLNVEHDLNRTLLGNVNIATPNECWPASAAVPLIPVIQLCIDDLPYIPEELKDIKYLCVFIHPDDPASFEERNDGLIIRCYKDNNITLITKPDFIGQHIESYILTFEEFNDYPCDYGYPSPLDYLSYLDKQKYYSTDKIGYEWLNDFSHESSNFARPDNCKIQGWPNWIQWPESPEDSTFIMQIISEGLWEYGDSSILYIYRNIITKEFWGFIQIY